MKINKLTSGRNLRWESSRMMLPKHVQALSAHIRETQAKEKPAIIRQFPEEMDRLVHEAVECACPG